MVIVSIESFLRRISNAVFVMLDMLYKFSALNHMLSKEVVNFIIEILYVPPTYYGHPKKWRAL